MLTIGLIGGVASGKSEVARLFEHHGATILNADRVGHDVLQEPDVIAEFTSRWGSRILDANGAISRKAVAAIVFSPGNETERQFLNEVSHPRIAARLRSEIEQLNTQQCPAVVLDAALLLEAGWDSFCDEIVFVEVPDELRQGRARVRGWDPAELTRREATQLPLQEKRSRATMVLENGGTREELAAQVAQLWQRWFPR